MNANQLATVQTLLGVSFRDRSLLEQALIHSSYVNEHKHAKHYERLEFLGDAVLQLVVSQYLYKQFPQEPEGELTRMRASIVCEPSLSVYARRLNLGEYIQFSKGEELTGGRERPSILADVFESVIGAIYLDQGIAPVEEFLGRVVFDELKLESRLSLKDAKSSLIERVQQLGLGLVAFHLIEDRGPDLDTRFVTEVVIGDQIYGRGEGRSKKESQQQAAAIALKKL